MSLLRILTTRMSKLTSCTSVLSRNKMYSTSIIKSAFDDFEIPDMTLSQFVWTKSEDLDDFPLATCGVSGRSYTYGMAKFLCKKGALALSSELSLKPGDRIGLLLPNIPEYLLVVYASLEAGFVVTFANPLYTIEELSRQFQSADVKCIVTIPQLLDNALDVAKTLTNYNCTINIGGTDEPGKKTVGLQSLLAKEFPERELPTVKSTDIAVLPYSSGTMGFPKGVMLTHRNLIINILQMEKSGEPDPPGTDVVFTVLPFFHIFGFNMNLNFMTYLGVHIVTIPRFVPHDYIECLEKFKPTTLFVVPSLMIFLLTHPDVKREHLASVRRIICGAAPVKKSLIDKFTAKFGNECVINQGYGMTETSPVTLYTPKSMPKNSKAGSCGTLLPMTEARVINLVDGKDVGIADTPGELLVRGPQLMKGYWNDPIATSKTIDTEGWLHTGDVVYYDEDKYFYVVDRTKELIKVKGNQVSPTELESLILEVPGVADAAVVGTPDDLVGELPTAYVVKKQDLDVTAVQIQDYVTPKVASYKKLAGGVIFIEAIPRNSSGKIMRSELRSRCRKP